MDETRRPGLVKLSESDLMLEAPREDIRGRLVVDRAGEEIGTVDDLLIDDRERKVRFLEVESGGFLGIGENRSLIPVQAVTAIGPDQVVIAHDRAHVAGAPAYSPDVVEADPYLTNLYGHYGYPPYWAPGEEGGPFPYAL